MLCRVTPIDVTRTFDETNRYSYRRPRACVAGEVRGREENPPPPTPLEEDWWKRGDDAVLRNWDDDGGAAGIMQLNANTVKRDRLVS